MTSGLGTEAGLVILMRAHLATTSSSSMTHVTNAPSSMGVQSIGLTVCREIHTSLSRLVCRIGLGLGSGLGLGLGFGSGLGLGLALHLGKHDRVLVHLLLLHLHRAVQQALHVRGVSRAMRRLVRQRKRRARARARGRVRVRVHVREH